MTEVGRGWIRVEMKAQWEANKMEIVNINGFDFAQALEDVS